MRTFGYFLIVVGAGAAIIGLISLPEVGEVSWTAIREGLSGKLTPPKLAMIWGCIIFTAGFIFIGD